MMKSTVAIDFDGVIHRYSRGWHDGTCYDKPMDGAKRGLSYLLEKYYVFIHSTRNPEQIQDWMAQHFQFITRIIPVDTKSPFWNVDGVIGITQKKLAAGVYIDDRSVKFNDWNPELIKEIELLDPLRRR